MTPNSFSNTRQRQGSTWLLYTVPVLLLCLLVLVTWPYMRYYVDSDALSYLNIVQQYLNGDFAHAINGFWSPMGCWLTVFMVKATGLPLFTSAIIVNTISVAGLILSTQVLFSRFRTSPLERWGFGLMSSVFWTYALYFQSFTDFWQYFFLTLGLLLVLREDFVHKIWIWLLLGLLGSLAYFSKAYSFFFFPLMIFIAAVTWLRKEEKFNWKRLVAICLTAGLVMLALDAPWLYLLHQKYGFWTSSTAGKLNSSWYLAGTQEFKPGVKIIVPPPYKGSLFYFEDPYLAQGRFVHFYDSPKLFLKQVARIAYNGLGWVTTSNRISPFFFLTWLITLLLAARKIIRQAVPPALLILTLIYLVYPLPFWLFTFESGRYTWFIVPASAILSMLYAEKGLFPHLNPKGRFLFITVFFLSFLVTPVTDLKKMLGKGAAEHEMAQALGKLNIKGSFVSNRSYADGSISLAQLSWFSQNAWYCMPLNEHSTREVLLEAARYKVDYYFYFYDGTGDDYQLTGPEGTLLPELTHNTIPGLKVFRLQP